MTIHCYPMDAVAGAPEYTGRALRETMAALLGGARAGRPLGGITGVRPGTPSTTTTISGITWTLNPHAGVLDLMVAAEAGSYAYGVSEEITGDITAADATNARKGILYALLTDPAESAPGTPGVTIVYLAGTAASIPAVPATPALAMRLATVNQPLAGGGAATITFDAPFTAAAGGCITFRTSGDRDYYGSTIGSAPNQLGAVLGDPSLYMWSGSAWLTIAPATTFPAITPVIGYTLQADNDYSVEGKRGHLSLRLIKNVGNLVSGVAIATLTVPPAKALLPACTFSGGAPNGSVAIDAAGLITPFFTGTANEIYINCGFRIA